MESDEDLVNVRFMKQTPTNDGLHYIWPGKEDSSWEPVANVLTIIENPVFVPGVSSRRHQVYKFHTKDIQLANKLFKAM